MLRSIVRITLALSAVALFALTIAGEAARWSHPLDIVNHFRPLWLVAAVLAFIGAIVFRKRFAALMLAGIITLQGWNVVPELLGMHGRTAQASTPPLTLATVNIWSRNGDPTRLLPWLAESKADIIAFQEFPQLARTTLLPAMHETWPFVILHDGVALASRYPLELVQKVESIYRNGIFEQAPAIVARAQLPGGKQITIFATHLSYPFKPHWQGVQLANFPALVKRFATEPMVLMGDLNMTPWSQGLKRLDATLSLRRLTRAIPSWPSPINMFGARLPFPVMPIDHIYASHGLIPVLTTRGPFFGSDHYPVMVRVEVR